MSRAAGGSDHGARRRGRAQGARPSGPKGRHPAGEARRADRGAGTRGAAGQPTTGASPKGLSRVLSRAGLCSRKEAEGLIAERRVRVNGRVVRDAEARIDEQRDVVQVDGRRLGRSRPLVIMFNKPAQCVTTLRDERGRRTVYDLLGELESWVVPVGRLDRDTTGLLLLTNDTLLADRITDPRTHLPKTYLALVRGLVSDQALSRLRDGVELEDGPTRPADVQRLRTGRRGTLLRIVITEGRNRQVRRMVAAIGSQVLHLRRLAVGPQRLSGLPRGSFRPIEGRELSLLRAAAGVPARPQGKPRR